MISSMETARDNILEQSSKDWTWNGLWCTCEGGGLITLLCRCKDMPSPCCWCVPLMLPSSVFAQTLAINCCKGVDIVVPEGWDIFCWTLVLLSDSIRRMFWEWAHACVKVSTFTTITRRTKLPKWYENSYSQLYILIHVHILHNFLNGPNNLSIQNYQRFSLKWVIFQTSEKIQW